jgi:hypothetical protein
MNELKKRIAPFLTLLDAKYMPLLFAVAPQAYSVYIWLFPHPYDGWGECFAVMGAIGFEAVYVGAVAWADEGKSSLWTWITAIAALVFSVLVAYHVHEPTEHAWAWLHAGFPLVAFAYTINMYVATAKRVSTQPQPDVAPMLLDVAPVLTMPEVVKLIDVDGLTASQVATMFNVTRQAISQRYAREKAKWEQAQLTEATT